MNKHPIKKINCQKNGFGLIEIIVAMAILIAAGWTILEIARYGLGLEQRNQIRTQAMNLANEAMEAAHSVRDDNWNSIASLELNKKYYPVISNNKWVLSPNDPGPIDNLFSQWVIFERVYRDDNDDISETGFEDPGARKIKAVVEWTEKDKNKQFTLTSYLTNWREND